MNEHLFQGDWHFPLQRPDSERQNPTYENLFYDQTTSGKDGKETFPKLHSLIRESVQNSLDARQKGEDHVHVIFRIQTMDNTEKTRQSLHTFFQRLTTPLQDGFHVEWEDVMASPIKTLVYEDYHTRGLEGDVGLFHPPQNREIPEDFFWFWRNSGESDKQGQLGRWGVGKTIFNVASKVHARLGVSCRQSDRKRSLMGKVMMKIHFYEGNEYEAFGTWCRFDKENNVPLPVESEETIAAFCQFWNIQREEPGLSVVVPFLREGIEAEGILNTLMSNFFIKILRGELTAEIIDGKSQFLVCRETWDALLSHCETELQANLHFVRQILENKPPFYCMEWKEKRVPEYEDLKKYWEKEHSEIREKFLRKEPLAFRFSLVLPHRNGNCRGMLDVYLQASDPNTKNETFFVREGMLIQKGKSKKHFMGLVLVEQDSSENRMSDFLGDSENPSHDGWNRTNPQLEEKGWKNSRSRIDFILGITNFLERFLEKPSGEISENILEPFFSLEVPNKKSSFSGSFERKKFPERLPATKYSWYYLEKKKKNGGFRLASRNPLQIPEKARLKIQVAYDIPQGNPFKNWTPLDFHFITFQRNKLALNKSFRYKRENVEWIPLEGTPPGNEIVLQIKDRSQPFYFEMTGFQKNRDICVEISDISSEERNVEEEPVEVGIL